MDARADSVEVFYLGPRDGWSYILLDDKKRQLGDAAYYFRKVDCITGARSHGLPVYVFTRGGKLQRKIKPKESQCLD